MHNKVAVVKVSVNKLKENLATAIDLCGGFSPKEGAKILVKPNLCCLKSADDGVTTDSRIVGAFIEYVNSKVEKSQIVILESNTETSANVSFRKLGYDKLASKYRNVQLLNLSKDETVFVKSPRAKVLRSIRVPKTLLSKDHFVSIAKMKRHILERYTGAWKNQYGLIPDRKLRIELHPFIPEALFDLNTMFHPDLAVIDGITALEGEGPLKGKPKRMNLVICSRNPLSADIVTAKAMGESHRRVPHVKYALTHGFKEAEKLIIKGEPDVFPRRDSFEFIKETNYLKWRFVLFRKKFRLTRVPLLNRI